MKQELVFKSVETPEEEKVLQRIATQTFNFSDESWDEYLPLVGRDNLRVAMAGGQLVAGMAHYPVKQWFAGNRIPAAAVALVCVAPEQRGRGIALEMLRLAMQEQRQNGVPLATLYPSTQSFYRKLGFEHAGNAYVYAFPMKAIGSLKQRLPMRQVEAAEHRQFHRLAELQARHSNGCLDRNEGMWQRAVRARAGRVFAYLIGEQGKESGYLIYDQRRDAGWHSDMSQQSEQRSIVVLDMVALNAETLETIWAFLSSNRTVTELVKWTGPAVDPRFVVTSEYEPNVIRANRWMLRLLDVKAALLQRGFADLDADIAFDVSDDMIAANQGGFTLRIRSGQPEIGPPSSTSPIRISAKNLAPLYSGFLTARQLQQLGMLSCEDGKLIDAVSTVFATSEPWMSDAF